MNLHLVKKKQPSAGEALGATLLHQRAGENPLKGSNRNLGIEILR